MPGIRVFVAAVGVHYLSLLLGVLASLFLTRQAFSLLGPEALGQWFMLLQGLAFLPLLDVGAQSLCTRELATALGSGREEDMLSAAHARRNQMLKLWPLLVVASLAVSWWARGRTSDEDVWAALSLALGANALVYPLRYGVAVLQGLQDQVFVGVLGLISTIGGTAVGVALLWRGHGFTALAAAWAVQQVLAPTLALVRLVTSRGSRWVVGRSQRRVGRTLFWGRGILVTLSGVIHGAMHGLDLLFVGSILGAETAASLAATGRLTGLVAMLGATMGQVAFPRLAQAHGRDQVAGAWEEAVRLGQLSALVAGLSATVAVLATPTFLAFWLGPRGEQLYAGALCGGAIGLYVVVRQSMTPLAFALSARGQDRRALLMSGVEAGAFVLLVPLVLRRFESVAALPLLQCAIAISFLGIYVWALLPRPSSAGRGGAVPVVAMIALSGLAVAASARLVLLRPGWALLAGPGLVAVHLLSAWLLLKASTTGRDLIDELRARPTQPEGGP